MALISLMSCTTTKFYVVRHAEKETNTMSGDVPLSEAGRQRAEALKELLRDKKNRNRLFYKLYPHKIYRTTIGRCGWCYRAGVRSAGFYIYQPDHQYRKQRQRGQYADRRTFQHG